MIVRTAQFIASHSKHEQAPTDAMPEFAFIGRSNVGKSSLINMLTGQKALAKVSGTPGKTQLLNYFLINETWRLVDLPGYGYARVSKTMRSGFSKMIEKYMREREQLWCAFVLIDANIEVKKIDIDFLRFLGEAGVPVAIVFTKTDRSSKRKIAENVAAFLAALAEDWEQLPPHFLTSAEKKTGREELLDFIETAMKSAQ